MLRPKVPNKRILLWTAEFGRCGILIFSRPCCFSLRTYYNIRMGRYNSFKTMRLAGIRMFGMLAAIRAHSLLPSSEEHNVDSIPSHFLSNSAQSGNPNFHWIKSACCLIRSSATTLMNSFCVYWAVLSLTVVVFVSLIPSKRRSKWMYSQQLLPVARMRNWVDSTFTDGCVWSSCVTCW